MHASSPGPADSSTKHLPIATSLNFQRVGDRLPFVCPIMFAGVPFIGEGVVHNISGLGCTVECDRPVLQGSYMKLRLLLPDRTPSLCIDLAAVRWVRAQYFGAEFLRLTPAEQTRLDEFLADRRR